MRKETSIMSAPLRALAYPIDRVARPANHIRYASRDGLLGQAVTVYIRTVFAAHAVGDEKAGWAATVVDGNRTVELSGKFSAASAYDAGILGNTLALRHLIASEFWLRPHAIYVSKQIIQGIELLPKWKETTVAYKELWLGFEDAMGLLQQAIFKDFSLEAASGKTAKALVERALDAARAAIGIRPKKERTKQKPILKPGDVV